MANRMARIIRICTVPPIMALVLCSFLYSMDQRYFAGIQHYLLSILFLTVLPLLPYPITALIPKLRGKGRPVQRNLAILFSIVGYMGGMLLALVDGTAVERVLFGTYTISGLLIALCSFGFRFKASGHSCGVAGPIAMLVYLGGIQWLWSALLLLPVCWASYTLKRHTWLQLAAGAAFPVAAMGICITIFL